MDLQEESSTINPVSVYNVAVGDRTSLNTSYMIKYALIYYRYVALKRRSAGLLRGSK